MPTDRLQIRRAELEVEQLKLAIFTKEVHIDELHVSIEREEESITATREKLAERASDLKALTDDQEVEE